MNRDEIIWEDERIIAFRKRGSMVLDSVQRNTASIGYAGSDRVNENGYDGFRISLDPVINEKGQPLRFALIAQNALELRTKINRNEPLSIATSYPVTGARLLGSENTFEYVSGTLEAELVDRIDEFDAGFELVQSGDSVQRNGVEIVEDGIEYVWLEYLTTL